MAKDLPDSWIGTDESGKGDYFGPLVVAAVAVTDGTAAALAESGVRDSKTLSDARSARLAERIVAACPHATVVVGPRRYNELYASIRNLNKLLAWAHARAIEDLLAEVDCPRVVVDQFANERVLEAALMERGATKRIEQRVRGESDPAVAAASILARARFVEELEDLSRTFGVKLALGAGAPVLASGKDFIAQHGAEALPEVAKVHFKTTKTLGVDL
jgi:ribonuclease HIII